jgi:hypothetical protein
MRETATLPHVPSAGTCGVGQEIRARESVTDVRHQGESASMARR